MFKRIRDIPKWLLLVGVAFGLTACGALPWNDQENAGLTDMHIYWAYSEANNTVYPVEIRVTDGKEFGSVNLAFQMSDGTLMNFNGVDVRAFRGQEIRADVEKAIAEVYGEIVPGLTDSILAAMTGGISTAATELPVLLDDDGVE